MTSTGRMIEANGTQLYVETAGTGEPLVFVHGFSLDTRLWDDQWDVFAQRFHVLRYDLRGFGRSALPTDQFYRHADDLAGLLDALGIDSAHLVGLSLGGGVVLETALAHPARVRSLVTVDAVLPGFNPADLGESIKIVWGTARSQPLDTVKALWLEQPMMAGAMADPAAAPRVRQMVGDYSGFGWIARDPGRWIEPATVERLGEIIAPTLALVGAGDLDGFKQIAQRIAADVPNARMEVIPGCGHLPNMEAPAAFNDALLAFLTA